MISPRSLRQSRRCSLVERDLSGCRSRRPGRTRCASVRGHDRSRPVPKALDPGLVPDLDALPLEQLVLDPVDAFDPALSVPLAAIAAVQYELVTEDRLGGFVAPDFAPLAVSVFEQVARRQDPRLGIGDRLYVGAKKSTVNSLVVRAGLFTYKMWYLWISRLIMYV